MTKRRNVSSREFVDGRVRNYVSRVLMLIEALRGAMEFAEADEVRRLAVELIKLPEIREAVKTALDWADGQAHEPGV